MIHLKSKLLIIIIFDKNSRFDTTNMLANGIIGPANVMINK